ncbi:MAG: TIGR02444 family protein [Alphaproteobacteria bacterium]
MADPAPWAFALGIHAAPGVEAFCLEMQDAHGADVNLLLCAAWCGVTGRGTLDEDDLARLAGTIAPMRREVVERLRAARRWLKPLAASAPRLAAMRERIKALELEAEREVQFLLADALEASHPLPMAPVARGARRAAAIASIDACMRHFGARRDPAPLARAVSDWIESN